MTGALRCASRMERFSMAYLLVIASRFVVLEAIPDRRLVSSPASGQNINLTIGYDDESVPPVWYNGTCGVSRYLDAGEHFLAPGAQIIGGVDARPYEFPWQVSFRKKPSGFHYCAGIVISERWILSAAHCVEGTMPSSIAIVVGEHDKAAESDIRQHHDVEEVFIHEAFDNQWLKNDVSLIKLKTNINITVNVTPVCAPKPIDLYANEKSQCSGWGTITPGEEDFPQILQYTTLNITTDEFCRKQYPKHPVTDDMLCATDNRGSTTTASCQGDSGGPLTVKGSDGVFSVVGIVSWSLECASGKPGVFARVSQFTGWISNIIKNN